ncbi:MAG: hypothetical protein LBI29_02310 [Rickettsiales bacterium]|jgi:hypothetical protein|nr:hypothetical protein [Rickettsiales bacterium]
MEDTIIDPKKDNEIFNLLLGEYVKVIPGTESLGRNRTRRIRKFLKRSEEGNITASDVDEYVGNIEILDIVERLPQLALDLNANLTFVSSVPLRDRFGDNLILSQQLLFDQIASEGYYNFIFTMGVGDNGPMGNADGGVHYVAARAVYDYTNKTIFLLHRDSVYGKISNEFRTFVVREFGEDTTILNINNQEGVMYQRDGTTCGLRALTSLATEGLFFRIEKK